MELGTKPSHGSADIASYGDDGYVEHFRDFFGIHSNEEAQFEDTGLAFVELFEPGEGIVDVEDIDGIVADAGDGDGFEGDGRGSTTALLAALFADVIDEHLAHDPGGNVIELGAMIPIGLVLPSHAEEGFVDEFRGAEDLLRVTAALEVTAGEFTQFGIDERDQAIHCAGVTLFPLAQ